VLAWGSISVAIALSQLVPSRPTGGREPRDAMLARMTSYYAEMRWMNAHLPPGAIVASNGRTSTIRPALDLGGRGFQRSWIAPAFATARCFTRSPRRGVTHLFARARTTR